MFDATFGSTPLLAALLQKRITADYHPERFRMTEADVRDLLSEATGFVERCRSLVAAEVDKGVDDPDPPPDF